jgi:thioredoxin-related protein
LRRGSSPRSAAAGGLPPAKDLAADAQAARRGAMPIVLFFSADSCPYCAEVAGLHLEPLHARGVYAGRALFRIADVERHTPVRGFDGRRLTQAELAGRYRVSFTPYITFLDPDGNELVPPLIGYSSPDFYSGYLESAIEAAIEKLRARRVASMN